MKVIKYPAKEEWSEIVKRPPGAAWLTRKASSHPDRNKNCWHHGQTPYRGG